MDVDAVRASKRTWETIASSFDATRRTPWPPVVDFLRSLPPGARVLDAGCGNGRHLVEASRHGHEPTGLDFSLGLLRSARARGADARLLAGLLERMPLRSGSFDAILSVASVHHLRGRATRIAAWREMLRVGRRGARLLATVWRRDQPRFLGSELRRPAGTFEEGDALVAWRRGAEADRFVHLYTAGELSMELLEAGWAADREWSEALGGAHPDNFLALARIA